MGWGLSWRESPRWSRCPDAAVAAVMSEAASSPSASNEAVDPKSSEPEPSVEYPATPEGDIDRLADEKGWVVDDLYPAASDFVADTCESMPVSAVDGASRPQWLAESGNMDGDGKAVLQARIPKLCPKWTPVMKQAVSGRYDRWFGDGTYVVSSVGRPQARTRRRSRRACTRPGAT